MAKKEERIKKDIIEIDLAKIARYILKHFWAVILCVVLCAAIGFSLATFVIPKEYQSFALFYVNNSRNVSIDDEGKITSQDITAAHSLVDTYMVVLKSNTVLDQIVKKTGLPYTRGELKSIISASPMNDTEVFEVKVRTKSAQDSTNIANAICDILPAKIHEIMENSSVKIIDYASLPTVKCFPSVKSFTIVGGIIGLVIILIVLIVLSFLDKYIRDRSDLETYSDIPILAMIPDLSVHKKGTDYQYYYYSNGGRK